MTPARIKKLRISTQIFKALLVKGEHHFRVIERALPDDVKIIGVYDSYPSIWFLLESKEWPELKDGDVIPEVESPIFDKIEMESKYERSESILYRELNKMENK